MEITMNDVDFAMDGVYVNNEFYCKTEDEFWQDVDEGKIVIKK